VTYADVTNDQVMTLLVVGLLLCLLLAVTSLVKLYRRVRPQLWLSVFSVTFPVSIVCCVAVVRLS
jgi:glucan phosphoethanolaminetransferase (alkaline phosphatase superfamily)